MIELSIFVIAIVGILILNYSSFKKQRAINEIHRIEMLQQRNHQVSYFRIRLLNRFNVGVITCMPSYDEMLYSDKPLEAKEWVDVDKLINLN